MHGRYLLVLFSICTIASCAWTETNCTVIKNTCLQVNSTCIWRLDPCRVDNTIPCDPQHCCDVDECGDLFQAYVMVQVDYQGEKVNTTVYNTLTGGAISPRADVDSFLTRFQNGTHHKCWYKGDPVLTTMLDKELRCRRRGVFNIVTETCECKKGWSGEKCENEDEPPSAGVVRKYFIAAEEVIWDYAPSGLDNITQMGLLDNPRMMHNPKIWVENNPRLDRIGKVYKKARYVEYSDETFTLPMRADPHFHLGLLGPIIRASVGETIRVVFMNKASRPYSIHPHGVLYTKVNEGASYAGGPQEDGNKVNPGDTYTYQWEVPARAGPGPNDPSSIVWFYHSHVDEGQDTNTGLVGPLIITRAGAGDYYGRPKDVDREFVAFFTIYDETRSWYLKNNIVDYLNPNATADDAMMLSMDEDFIFSSRKHSINGYLYGNVPAVSMQLNERVRWYVMSLGTENDIHGAHWHGTTLTYQGSRVDTIEMIPGSTKTLDMVPDVEGTWLFHCHTNHHIHGGMTGLFHVTPCTKKNGCGAPGLPPVVAPVAKLPMWPFVLAATIVSVFVAAGLVMVWWLKRKRSASYHSVELAE